MSEDNTPLDAEGEAAIDAIELDAARAEVAQLKEQVLRFAAEAENTKRRAEREANDARAYAIQKFARDLLGVADNLARAMQAQPKDSSDPAVKNFLVGIEMTEKELLSAFEKNGLKRIHPEAGEKFDPHQHQAMAEQPGEGVAPPGSVLQVYQSGYELLGRLVRPAMVVVAAKTAGAPTGESSPSGAYATDEGEAGGSVDRRA